MLYLATEMILNNYIKWMHRDIYLHSSGLCQNRWHFYFYLHLSLKFFKLFLTIFYIPLLGLFCRTHRWRTKKICVDPFSFYGRKNNQEKLTSKDKVAKTKTQKLNGENLPVKKLYLLGMERERWLNSLFLTLGPFLAP